MTFLVHSLGFIHLDVQDLERAIRDSTQALGLRLVSRSNEQAFLTSNTRRAELVLSAAGATRVRSIGLEAYDAEAVAAAKSRAADNGFAVADAPPSLPFVDSAVTLVSEEGLVFEVHTPVPEDQPRRFQTVGVTPRKIDHVGPKSGDTKRLSRQLEGCLGLRVSERSSGDELIFMRAGNGQHHTLSLIGGQPGIHHYAWELWQFHDFMRLGDALDLAGLTYVYGPGRHGMGDNMYTYHLDASTVMIECCAGMEMIANEPLHQVRTWDIADPKLVNRWGVAPPDSWLAHSTPFAPVAGGLRRAS